MTARVALVTGASRGIGRATASALAEAGDRVVATSRTPGESRPGVRTMACDVTDTADVERTFGSVEEEMGPVEVLVANAGTVRDRLLVGMPDTDFEAVWDTNLHGAVRVARRALRGMILARHGRIVLVSSVSAFTGSPGQTNYAAAKAGLVGLARSLTRELGARDITVNVVAPGWIDTDMTASMSGEERRRAEGAVPMGRFGRAEEVAAVIRFLTRRDAGYVTGAVVPVDGGIGMGC